MSSEVSKKLNNLVSKELEQLALKGSLTPVELDTANKAVELMTKILKYDEMCERKERGEAVDPMEYSELSYRMPRHSMMYDEYSMNNYGLNVPGMYGSYRNQPRNAMGQYSGHSIRDRMIDKLERMMNEAETEYERKEIMEEISRIRQSS